MDYILQNEATAGLREFDVKLVDVNGNAVPGLTVGGGLVAKIAKPGANFGALAGTVTELTGGATGGVYRVQLTAGEVDAVGILCYEFTKAGVIQQITGSVPIRPAQRSVDFADNFLTAVKIATDAIDADALKTDGITEIVAATWGALLADTRVSGSIGELVQRVAGRLHGNSMIDNIVYGANNVMTSGRLRVFTNAAALASATPGNANGADGEIFRDTITAVDAGSGQISSFKLSQGL